MTERRSILAFTSMASCCVSRVSSRSWASSSWVEPPVCICGAVSGLMDSAPPVCMCLLVPWKEEP